MKNRGIAIVLALFLGGFGVHKFYVGRIGQGFLYLVFCWTFVPSIIGIFEAIRWAVIGEDKFQKLYK